MLLAALALRVADPTPVRTLRLMGFDTLQRLEPRAYEPVPVRIIDLDDKSLAIHGQWPWPRTRIAELVDTLSALGAAVIAFDIVFAEPDRTSPRQLVETWSDVPALQKLVENDALPDHDEVLAEAFSKARVVTGFTLASGRPSRSPIPKAGFAYGGDDPTFYLPYLAASVSNLPILEEAAQGNGSFSVVEDADGVHRRVPLLFRHGERLYPALAAEAVRVAYGASAYKVKSAGASGEQSYGERTGITHVQIAGITAPTDPQGRFWVHFTEPRDERFIPAWKVLDGSADPAEIAGSILLVGTSASGLKDLRTTPLDPVAPGVVVHAEVIEQLLLEHFLQRPDWATGAELIYMLVLGTLLVVVLRLGGPIICAGMGVGAVAGALGFSWYAYTEWKWLFDPVFPSFVALAVYIEASTMNYLRSDLQRRHIRRAFSQYLSPDFVDQLARSSSELKLGGERRIMSIMFSDVRGFTTISEQFENPEDLTNLINRFLTPMTRIIMESGGTIDKYIGDCIMAFWNAPLDDPDHERNACLAAMQMMRGLKELNVELMREAEESGRSYIPLNVGVGINTGSCCVGNMGSDLRFDYSVLGDEVNLASRLEGQSKTYGVDIVLGDKTRDGVPDFATLEIDRIRVKGKREAVVIHTLLGDESVAAEPRFQELTEAHAAMLKTYRAQEWDVAEQHIETCRGLAPELEGLYGLYDERIATYRTQSPGSDWDGVYTATSK